MPDAPCQPGRLVEVGPVELPGDPRSALDQIAPHVPARRQLRGPRLQPLLVRPLILVGQHDGRRRQPMLQRIEPDLLLPLRRFRPGTPGGIPASNGLSGGSKPIQ